MSGGVEEECIGLDAEFIELLAGSRMAAARVALVDASGAALLDAYVRHEPASVRDYHTRYSGIMQHHVDGSGPTLSLAEAQAAVLALARGRVVVGHNLDADLRALSLARERFTEVGCVRLVDTALLDWGARDSLKLRALADELLGEAIQTGEHCPVDDALASLRLHLLHAGCGGQAPPLPRTTVTLCLRPAEGRAGAGCDGGRREERLEIEWSRRSVRALLQAQLLPPCARAPSASASGRGAALAASQRGAHEPQPAAGLAEGRGPFGPTSEGAPPWPQPQPQSQPQLPQPQADVSAARADGPPDAMAAAHVESVRFAPGLGKGQRALVHALATELRLVALSAGVGPARHVAVSRRDVEEGSAAGAGGRGGGRRRGGARGRSDGGWQGPHGPLEPALEARAAALYRAAQEEGGFGRASGKLSRDEARELVRMEAEGRGELPEELRRLAEERLLPPLPLPLPLAAPLSALSVAAAPAQSDAVAGSVPVAEFGDR